MSSVYFIKEKSYTIIVELNSIQNETRQQDQGDPDYIRGNVSIYLNNDSFSTPKYIGGSSYLYTYLSTSNPDNKTTQLYLQNPNDIFETDEGILGIPIAKVWGTRDLGQAVGDYHLKIAANADNDKVTMKGFSTVNDVVSSSIITGVYTITAPAPSGGDTPDNPEEGGGDDPGDMTPELDYNSISITNITDEEWEWLKGINNE